MPVENDFLCYTLFCDDFSEDSKFRYAENDFLCCTLFCDDFSKDLKFISVENDFIFFLIIPMAYFVLILMRVQNLVL